MRCAIVQTLFLFSTIETRSLSSEKLYIDVGLLEEKLKSENLSAKTSLAGTMKTVELVVEELEGVVQAWENLLPDILACYASLSGGE